MPLSEIRVSVFRHHKRAEPTSPPRSVEPALARQLTLNPLLLDLCYSCLDCILILSSSATRGQLPQLRPQDGHRDGAAVCSEWRHEAWGTKK